MSTDKTVRRSKVYTYFYGRNNVLQKFIIVVGILLFMLSGLAEMAEYANYYNKAERLRDNYYEAQENYYRVSNSGADTARAIAKMEKARDKMIQFEEKGYNGGFFAKLTTVLGIACVVGGLGWIVYKKWSFNRDGEKEYDEELADCIAVAKQKALEKLNIVAEQIESVDPVVLNGFIGPESVGPANARGLLRRAFVGILRSVLMLEFLIFGTMAAALIRIIASIFARNLVLFILVFLAILGGVGFVGYLIYKKYERDSYVSAKVFKRLLKFPPRSMAKLGSDDHVRVSLPAITVYMFGEEQLYMYYQYLDIVTGKVFCEGVHEYFYEDIVGVTSKQEVEQIYKRYGFLKLRMATVEYLNESISVVTSGCIHRESYIVDLGHSLLDTQFVGMRNLIRQKKAEP